MKKSKGGMQSAGTNYSIHCPKCGKPAFKVEENNEIKLYYHFTKKGHIAHEIAITKEAAP